VVGRKFVYKWLKRFKENPEGEWWKNRSSMPKTLHMKVDEELRERIRELRVKQGMNVRGEDSLPVKEERKSTLSNDSDESNRGVRSPSLE